MKPGKASYGGWHRVRQSGPPIQRKCGESRPSDRSFGDQEQMDHPSADT